MLVSLFVKNLALIDEASVEFGPGLNILSGETGAGKSILIGSINLALGAKADKDCIRNGADQAVIELVFQLESEAQLQKMRELDLPVEDDNLVILQRKITPQRAVCKVCGETVSAKQLQELSELLIHIHGQRDNQVLLKSENQLEYLDAYAGTSMKELLLCLSERYEDYRAKKHACEELEKEESAGKRELSLAQFEVEEIEQAAMQPGEDEELEKRFRKMQNSRKIMDGASKAYEITGYRNMQGAGNLIGEALRELKGVAAVDEQAEGICEQLLTIDSLLNDFNRDLSDYMSECEFDEGEYVQTEDRLNELNRLKAKYGESYEEIQSYLQKQQDYLLRMSDFEAYKQKAQVEYEEAEKHLKAICSEVSAKRKESAVELGAELEKALSELNFLDVQVRIDVLPVEHYSRSGLDQVVFMISMNTGEPLKPLANVASGGELSRIMLACRTILADQEHIDAMIFDEIDAGISGRTAWKVSEKLGTLSRKCQVICITHLPQIAAMADEHFVIEKNAENQRTATSIRPIAGDEQLRELARMLGGDTITDAVMSNAAEMRAQALETKQ